MLERTPSFRFDHALVDSKVMIYRSVDGFQTRVRMSDRDVVINEREPRRNYIRQEEGEITVMTQIGRNNPNFRPALLMTHLSDHAPLILFHTDQGQTVGYGFGHNIGETIGLSLLGVEPHRGVVSRRVIEYLLAS